MTIKGVIIGVAPVFRFLLLSPVEGSKHRAEQLAYESMFNEAKMAQETGVKE